MSRDQRFHFLDGLRGIASLLVLLAHFYFFALMTDPVSSRLAGLWPVAHGHLGVQVFFVLSGFVIAYTQRNAQPRWGYFGRFIARRSLRLDPPYLVAIVAMVLVSGELPGWRGLLINVFYLPLVFRQIAIVPQAWTLCYEVQFYIVLTLMLMWLPRRAVLALGLVMGVASLAIALHDGGNGWPGRWFLFMWYEFFLGALTWWTLDGLPLGVFAAFAGLVLGGGIAAGNERVIASVVVAVVILAVGRAGKLSTWLTNRPIQFFGRISYSVYLLHWPVAILVVQRHLPDALNFTVATTLTIGAAWLSHRFLERPGIELGRRLFVHKPPTIPAQAALLPVT